MFGELQIVDEHVNFGEHVEKTGKSATCGRELHNPEDFPEDFPDEWKMCCSCSDYAKRIVETGHVIVVVNMWYPLIKIECRDKFLELIKKIDKLIKVI